MSVYMKMDGVKGSASDEKHKDQVQVTAMFWGASRNIKTLVGNEGSREGSSISFGEVEIRKAMDKGSADLLKKFWNMETTEDVEIDICRQGSGSGDESLLKFTLKGVLISMYETIAEGTVPTERFTLNYNYLEQKLEMPGDKNDAGQPTITGYNLVGNKKI